MEEQLINAAASQVHTDWCIEELKAFYERLQQELPNCQGKFGEAFNNAQMKNGVLRNPVNLDTGYLMGHESEGKLSLTDFKMFLHLYNLGVYNIKRMKNEENILVPFDNLSDEAKKENLDSAIGAYKVFQDFCKAGFSVEQIENNPELKETIGMAIHTDWIKRNKDTENKNLLVSYDKLDDWTKSQDITVFKALLDVAKKQNVVIQKEENFMLPNYKAEENEILESLNELASNFKR